MNLDMIKIHVITFHFEILPITIKIKGMMEIPMIGYLQRMYRNLQIGDQSTQFFHCYHTYQCLLVLYLFPEWRRKDSSILLKLAHELCYNETTENPNRAIIQRRKNRAENVSSELITVSTFSKQVDDARKRVYKLLYQQQHCSTKLYKAKIRTVCVYTLRMCFVAKIVMLCTI